MSTTGEEETAADDGLPVGRVYHRDESVTLVCGDALDALRGLADGSADCVVTSPPYFGLRDYGTEGQYGLESSPAEYVGTMRRVFREARRVLADDGTLWLNLGDSYYSGKGAPGSVDAKQPARRGFARQLDKPGQAWAKPKNLLGMPWRVAFALQEDGWVLRNAIVWHKTNAMPESVRDRLAGRHELVFLFAKSQRYWFDLDPVRKAHAEATIAAAARGRVAYRAPGQSANMKTREMHPGGANPGDVWSIPAQPFRAAHFATMPPALAERCVAAGCKPRKCRVCGHAPTPVKERGGMDLSRPQARRALEIASERGLGEEHFAAIRAAGATDAGKAAATQSGAGKNTGEVARLAAEAKSALGGYYREFLLDREVTTGWSDCGHGSYTPGVVLDPFSGSGTTGLAAARLGRKYIGIDLNPEYLRLSLETRLKDAALAATGDRTPTEKETRCRTA